MPAAAALPQFWIKQNAITKIKTKKIHAVYAKLVLSVKAVAATCSKYKDKDRDKDKDKDKKDNDRNKVKTHFTQ